MVGHLFHDVKTACQKRTKTTENFSPLFHFPHIITSTDRRGQAKGKIFFSSIIYTHIITHHCWLLNTFSSRFLTNKSVNLVKLKKKGTNNFRERVGEKMINDCADFERWQLREKKILDNNEKASKRLSFRNIYCHSYLKLSAKRRQICRM